MNPVHEPEKLHIIISQQDPQIGAPKAADTSRHARCDRPQVICGPSWHQCNTKAQAQGHRQDEAVAPREAVNACDLCRRPLDSDLVVGKLSDCNASVMAYLRVQFQNYVPKEVSTHLDTRHADICEEDCGAHKMSVSACRDFCMECIKHSVCKPSFWVFIVLKPKLTGRHATEHAVGNRRDPAADLCQNAKEDQPDATGDTSPPGSTASQGNDTIVLQARKRCQSQCSCSHFDIL